MDYVQLGRTGPQVSRIGLGCWGMSGTYGPGDDAESIRTLDRALELGLTFLDTADTYGDGHNESFVGAALRGRRDRVVLATKFGRTRSRRRTRRQQAAGYVRSACDASQRLGVTRSISITTTASTSRSHRRNGRRDGRARRRWKSAPPRALEAKPDNLRLANAVPDRRTQSEYSLHRDVGDNGVSHGGNSASRWSGTRCTAGFSAPPCAKLFREQDPRSRNPRYSDEILRKTSAWSTVSRRWRANSDSAPRSSHSPGSTRGVHHRSRANGAPSRENVAALDTRRGANRTLEAVAVKAAGAQADPITIS